MPRVKPAIPTKESKRARGMRLLEQSERCFDILQDVSVADKIVGFIFGGPSVYSAKKIATQRAKEKYNLKKRLLQLEAYELIRRRNGSEPVFEITQLGKTMLSSAKKYQIRKVVRARSVIQSWDKKWRMVTFDIPESMRRERDALRYLLQRHSYFQLQKNVWVFPFENDELSEFIFERPELRDMIVRSVVSDTTADVTLRKHFKLEHA
jgi:hypothetical protein